eukprot:XP_001705708.1 Hypothetical protein GL50803_90644 [Giardia lamblia ATCC 50803]
MAGLITEENLGGHVRHSHDSALTPQGVYAEAKASKDDVFVICADEDIGRPKIAVNKLLNIYLTNAVEIGEGGSDLFHNEEDHANRDKVSLSFVLGEKTLESLVVAIHDNVNEALVLNNLMVPEDPWVGELGEGNQL